MTCKCGPYDECAECVTRRKLDSLRGLKRLEYLVGVLQEFMQEGVSGEQEIHYDEADCDGSCLADDFTNVLMEIKYDLLEAGR